MQSNTRRMDAAAKRDAATKRDAAARRTTLAASATRVPATEGVGNARRSR
jgi:hypothetical protein